MLVTTTDKWNKNAEDVLDSQQPPVIRLRVRDLDDSTIDWGQFALDRPDTLARKAQKTIRPHQAEAIERVARGFEGHDRGRIIMACGTGKTYTALKIAERLASPGSLVLFLVPSISLLSQSLKEWTAEAAQPLRAFAVCSDTTVGKKTANEDMRVHDLAYPATTDATKLIRAFRVGDTRAALTVIFSTYQSIAVLSEAQRLGLPEMDLIICDEAHRTTGATLVGEEESHFVRVHDQGFLKARKRLYMTATPRIYTDGTTRPRRVRITPSYAPWTTPRSMALSSTGWDSGRRSARGSCAITRSWCSPSTKRQWARPFRTRLRTAMRNCERPRRSASFWIMHAQRTPESVIPSR